MVQNPFLANGVGPYIRECMEMLIPLSSVWHSAGSNIMIYVPEKAIFPFLYFHAPKIHTFRHIDVLFIVCIDASQRDLFKNDAFDLPPEILNTNIVA